MAELRAAGDDDAAGRVAAAPLDPPDAPVDDVAYLDVGGREVVLRSLGRGHTDADLVVEVETAGDGTVVFAGDLVEEGAPPAFEDAFPAEWPATLGRLHALARGPVVPGHGAVVDAAFVGAQREELLAVLAAVRSGRLDRGPYDPATMALAASPPRQSLGDGSCARATPFLGQAADHRQRQDAQQRRRPGATATRARRRAPARARSRRPARRRRCRGRR